MQYCAVPEQAAQFESHISHFPAVLTKYEGVQGPQVEFNTEILSVP